MRYSNKLTTWALLLAPLLFAGCFDLDEPVCAFRCGSSSPECPDHYTCQSDGFCHRNGTTTACPFPDLSTQADQAVPKLDGSSMDQSVGPPDAGVDGAAPDLSSNADLAMATDSATAPDLSSDLSSVDL
jgi:hypothetical protein